MLKNYDVLEAITNGSLFILILRILSRDRVHGTMVNSAETT